MTIPAPRARLAAAGLGLLLLVAGCAEDSDSLAERPVRFTIHANEGCPEESHGFVFTSHADGTVHEVKSWSGKASLELRKPLDGGTWFSYTLVRPHPDGSVGLSTSYTEMGLGAVIYPASPCRADRGEVQVEFSDLPSHEAFAICSAASRTEGDQVVSPVSHPLRTSPADLFVRLDTTAEGPVGLWVDGVMPGGTVPVPLDGAVPLAAVVVPVEAAVHGLTADIRVDHQGTWATSPVRVEAIGIEGPAPETVTMFVPAGGLDRTLCRIVAVVDGDDRLEVTHAYQGRQPDRFTRPGGDVVVAARSPDGILVTGGAQQDHAITSWSLEGAPETTWTCGAPQELGKHRLPDLPAVVQEALPNLRRSDFTMVSATLWRLLESDHEHGIYHSASLTRRLTEGAGSDASRGLRTAAPQPARTW